MELREREELVCIDLKEKNVSNEYNPVHELELSFTDNEYIFELDVDELIQLKNDIDNYLNELNGE